VRRSVANPGHSGQSGAASQALEGDGCETRRQISIDMCHT